MSFFRRISQALFPPPKPCYRCGVEANPETDFAGYHYCTICRDVVHAVQASVAHDPPFGFPGARGYIEFPVKEGESKNG